MTTRGDGNATAWTGGEGSGAPLRAFTTTAQVPPVAGLAPGGLDAFAPTGTVPVLAGARRAPAPLGLRVAVWVTGALVAAGLALLGVHRARPSWLAAIEAGAPGAGAGAPPSPASSSTTSAAGRPGQLRLSQSGPASATVTVPSPRYSVLVSVEAQRCWVQASTPGSPAPVFAGVLAQGARQSFRPDHGRLTLELGASGVTVTVTLAGSRSPAWQYTPQQAPFTLDFTASS